MVVFWLGQTLGTRLPNWTWHWPLYNLDPQGQILNLAKIAKTLLVMERFDWQLNKRTLTTKQTFSFLQVWNWHDLDCQGRSHI